MSNTFDSISKNSVKQPTGIQMKIGFIGAGQMASAIAAGVAAKQEGLLFAFDPNEKAIQRMRHIVEETGCQFVIADNNQQIVDRCDFVFIAVKPQSLEKALSDVDGSRSNAVFVSVVAGISTQKLIEKMATNKIIRTMPNTPCLVGQGAIAIASSENLPSSVSTTVIELMSSVGNVEVVPEHMMDAVTGLSGSGPAYVYLMAEAMIAGGVKCGLSSETSTKLALQTILGAARMMVETEDSPSVLRERVSSPGGTTVCGLETLEKGRFSVCIMQAIHDASNRSSELSSV